jgi:hypothetical protein
MLDAWVYIHMNVSISENYAKLGAFAGGLLAAAAALGDT